MDTSALRVLANSLLADNGQGEISAGDMRAVVEAIAEAIDAETAARTQGDAFASAAPPDVPQVQSHGTTIDPSREAVAVLNVNILPIQAAKGYELLLQVNGGATTAIPFGSVTMEARMPAGSTYAFSVRSVGMNGAKSDPSAEITGLAVRDQTPPQTPTFLPPTSGVGSIFLRWTKVPDSDLRYYEVFEGTSDAPPLPSTAGTFISSVETFSRIGLPSGSEYVRWYAVRAVDTSGNKSPWSAMLQASSRRAVAADIDSRGLNILDIYGNEVFSSSGKIAPSAFVTVNGNNVHLSEIAAASLTPSLNYVGEFPVEPTQGELGTNWRQNAVYKNSLTGKSYVLTGNPLAWVEYLSDGLMFNLEIESSNGTVFRPGFNQSTLLKARLFKNGAEVTDETPASWFRWRRVSIIPQSAPNDDATFNSLYGAGGYKQLSISVDQVFARATFFCDIISN